MYEEKTVQPKRLWKYFPSFGKYLNEKFIIRVRF